MGTYDDFNGSSWIGVPEKSYAGREWNGRIKAQTAYFRREFDLNDMHGKMVMHISAASRYRLYINGVSLLSGPCKGDRFRHFYETVDVSKYLRWGRNIIFVKVMSYPPYDAITEQGDGVGPQFMFGTAAGPCLVVGGEVLGRDGRRMASVNTGESLWRVCLDDAVELKTPRLSYWMGGMEVVDGAKLPEGLLNSNNPGGTWEIAENRWPVYPNGTGGITPFPLKPRPIPLLYEKQIEFTAEMPLNNGDAVQLTFAEGKAAVPPYTRAAIELDAGYLTTAYLTLPMLGGKGSEIIIRYAECYSGSSLSDKGDRADSVNFRLNGHQDMYYPSGGEERYTPFWFRTFRFIRIEVQTDDTPVVIYKPEMTETGYPLDFKTTFKSSDENLNKLWEISKRTLSRCMHETYEDCPYYEQLQYTMDTRLQMLFTYAMSGDTRMALRTIDDYHASILPEGILQSRYPCQVTQVIPVFALHWIFMLEDYYEQTGDLSVPERYRATIENVLAWYSRHIDESGLVGKTAYWQFTDWVEKWERQHGMSYASAAGPSTTNNLTYALALRSGARLNRLTGRGDAACEYESKADEILKTVQKYCWDDKRRYYSEGPGFDEYGQHAQVLAVLAGIADDPADLIIKALSDGDLLTCSFPWMFYFIRALENTGNYEKVSFFNDRLTDFVKLNATTIPERHYRVRSECHAWGAFPLYEFPRSILGVRPGEPGWKKIIVKPFYGASDCEGTVTTPVGDVHVKLERINGAVRLSGRAPDGVCCETTYPDGTVKTFENGGEF